MALDQRFALEIGSASADTSSFGLIGLSYDASVVIGEYYYRAIP